MSNTPSYYNKGGLQPKEVIKRWDLNFFEGNVIKYICRWREKGGQGDLRKAIDNINELIEGVEDTPCPPCLPYREDLGTYAYESTYPHPHNPYDEPDPFADWWAKGGE